jgi:sec-independent protein translocase protein TatA
MPTPLAMFSPGPMEMIIIGIVAVLLFGKRLPEVGRSLGRGLVEFKKGVRGIDEDADEDDTSTGEIEDDEHAVDDHEEPTAQKFDPPKDAAQQGASG